MKHAMTILQVLGKKMCLDLKSEWGERAKDETHNFFANFSSSPQVF
jgi:hypothetical protein